MRKLDWMRFVYSMQEFIKENHVMFNKVVKTNTASINSIIEVASVKLMAETEPIWTTGNITMFQ
jgi:hypothetical protein